MLTDIQADEVIHRDWQSAFGTTERDEAAAMCRAMRLEAEWLDDGSLIWLSRRSGFSHLYRWDEGEWTQLTRGDWVAAVVPRA